MHLKSKEQELVFRMATIEMWYTNEQRALVLLLYNQRTN